MIDQLVRDALESQVAPPPAPDVWPRIDRAGELARRLRRRARVASVAVVSVVALLAVVITWGALRSDGSGTRITVTTSPAPVATPSVAAGTNRLPTVADWKRPSGYSLRGVALSDARLAEAGRALVFYQFGGGVCDEPQAYRVHTSASRVSVELVQLDQGQMSCPGLTGMASFLVMLPGPLGHRQVVDGTTGRHVALLDAAHLLVPTVLLPGWPAQTEGLTDQDTWTRCYGPSTCDYYQGPAITTAQGTDVDDVLSASLRYFDDLSMHPATFAPSLAHAAFTYGSSSAHRGQSLPSSAKVAIDVNGADGVVLTSWSNYTLLWHVGSTWYAVSTPRNRSTVGARSSGVGIPELIHFARGLAPAR